MTVTLVDSMGDDLIIVNAARVSHAKKSDWDYTFSGTGPNNATKSLREADKGLIGYLMRNRHGTPFEMVQFQFHISTFIGVAREWQRHRIGSFNEVSTRYVEMAPEFYHPPDRAVRSQIGKPGHYEMVQMTSHEAEQTQKIMEQAYKDAHRAYLELINHGVAKELARNVLPLGLSTEFYWSVNLRSVFNFLSLRTAPSALYEIREEAYEVERWVNEIAPVALEAFRNNGRVAP